MTRICQKTTWSRTGNLRISLPKAPFKPKETQLTRTSISTYSLISMTANNVTEHRSQKFKETKNLRKKSTDSKWSLMMRTKIKSLLRLDNEITAVTNHLLKLQAISNPSAAAIKALFPKTIVRCVRKNRSIVIRTWNPVTELIMLTFMSRYKLHKHLATTLNRFKFRWSTEWRR